MAEDGFREQQNPMYITKWKLRWRRDRFEWEKLLEEQMLNCISGVQWRYGSPDGWVWQKDDDQQHKVKTGYMILNGNNQAESMDIFN